MVFICSVAGCLNKFSDDGNVDFHKFPLCDKKLLDQWILSIGRCNSDNQIWEPNENDVICSDHFLDSDYSRFGFNRVLKIDSVPSVFQNRNAYQHLCNDDSFQNLFERNERAKRTALSLNSLRNRLKCKLASESSDQVANPAEDSSFIACVKSEPVDCISLKNLCRLCGSEMLDDGESLFSIDGTESQILMKLHFVAADLPVQLEDGFPQKICFQCSARIEESYSFINLMVATFNRFRGITNDHNEKEDEDFWSNSCEEEEESSDYHGRSRQLVCMKGSNDSGYKSDESFSEPPITSGSVLVQLKCEDFDNGAISRTNCENNSNRVPSKRIHENLHSVGNLCKLGYEGPVKRDLRDNFVKNESQMSNVKDFRCEELCKSKCVRLLTEDIAKVDNLKNSERDDSNESQYEGSVNENTNDYRRDVLLESYLDKNHAKKDRPCVNYGSEKSNPPEIFCKNIESDNMSGPSCKDFIENDSHKLLSNLVNGDTRKLQLKNFANDNFSKDRSHYAGEKATRKRKSSETYSECHPPSEQVRREFNQWFTCDSCKKRIFSIGAYMFHNWKTHNVLLKTHCKYCDFETDDVYSFYQHIGNYISCAVYKCDICGLCAFNQDYIQRHRRNNHNRETRENMDTQLQP